MGYDSDITFVLDVICPWTYLAKRRLEKALAEIPSDAPVTFTVKYKPYQLYPNATQEGEDKHEWYRKSRYGGFGESDQKLEYFKQLMGSYGDAEDIKFNFQGTFANTLHAHRGSQHFQESKGPETANRFIDSLYRQYFEEAKHPSSHETLLLAATEAGIGSDEAKTFIENEDEELMETKMAIREVTGNGIDAVPYLIIEGKKRDVTLEGAREVNEYVTALNRVIKESS